VFFYFFKLLVPPFGSGHADCANDLITAELRFLYTGCMGES